MVCLPVLRTPCTALWEEQARFCFCAQVKLWIKLFKVVPACVWQVLNSTAFGRRIWGFFFSWYLNFIQFHLVKKHNLLGIMFSMVFSKPWGGSVKISYGKIGYFHTKTRRQQFLCVCLFFYCKFTVLLGSVSGNPHSSPWACHHQLHPFKCWACFLRSTLLLAEWCLQVLQSCPCSNEGSPCFRW